MSPPPSLVRPYECNPISPAIKQKETKVKLAIIFINECYYDNRRFWVKTSSQTKCNAIITENHRIAMY